MITETYDEEENSVIGSDSASGHVLIEGAPDDFLRRGDVEMTRSQTSPKETYYLKKLARTFETGSLKYSS